MPSSSLSSARSVFEQNIKKNKEAGFDKNVFGQKPSRKVTSRLFAQRRFYGANNNGANGSNRSLNTSGADNVPLRQSFQKESSKPSYDFHAQETNHHHHQQQNDSSEHNKQTLPQHYEEERTKPKRSQSGQQQQQQQQQKDLEVVEVESETARRKIKKEGSISSLADHLGKLNLSISRGKSTREDDASYTSSNSLNSATIEEHKNRVRLPDFRQSSSRNRRPFEGDSSFSSLDNSNNHQHHNALDTSTQSHQVRRRRDELDGSSQSNLDESRQSYQSYQGIRRTNSRRSQFRPPSASSQEHQHHPQIELKRSNSRRASSSRTIGASIQPKSIMGSSNNNDYKNNHGSNNDISHTSTRSEIVMTRRATSSKDWIRRSGHAESQVQPPLNLVPFPTRTVIKRHNSQRTNVAKAAAEKAQNRSTAMKRLNNTRTNVAKAAAERALTRNSPQVIKRSVSNRSRNRSEQQQQHQHKATVPIDPDEQELLDEIERLKGQINASEAKVDQIGAGEQAELKRIQETKDRKLRRVAATEKQAFAAESGSDGLCLDQEEEDLKLVEQKYKKVQQTIKNLKKENAKIHDDIRKMRIEILTTASNSGMIEESIAHMNQYVADLEKDQKRQLREHEQLLEMVATCQTSITDLKESLELKEPQISGVKKTRFRYEDSLEDIVDFIKAKCTDPDLIEELASMAVDEAGWDGDWSELPNERARLSVVTKTPNTDVVGEKIKEKRESPKSVTDLISTSSHSLHIFNEDAY